MLNTQTPGSIIVVQQAESRIGDNQNGPFGDPVTNSSVWAAHNPVVQIPKFATSGTKLWLGAGNGFPGPGDSGFALDAYVYESTALSQSQGFATKAKAAGIPVTTDWWGNGQHDWAAWTLHFPTAFAQTLAPAMGVPGT
jgi:S-formylglutathione hydrolase FrmB